MDLEQLAKNEEAADLEDIEISEDAALCTKSFNGSIQVDEDKGEVHALVAVFGNRDFEGDVILPGAFKYSIDLARKKGYFPPGVWEHNIDAKIADTKDMWEDKDGLHVIAKFDLNDPESRRVFYRIKNKTAAEYSVGYRELAKRRDPVTGTVFVQNLKLTEWSVTPAGMNDQTRTISVKSLPHGGLRLNDQSEMTLGSIEDWATRLEDLTEKCAAKGKSLGEEHLQRLDAAIIRLKAIVELNQPPAAVEAEAAPIDLGQSDEAKRAVYSAKKSLARIDSLLDEL